MQYQHGGSRGRMPPFARGGAYSRGQKQFYPPPPPVPTVALPPPPRNKYEVLMEAGRLAAEYLVTKGVLPPESLQRGAGAGAWGQLPPPPPPPLPVAQDGLAQYEARNGRRRVDDEYSNPENRSQRNRRGDYSSSDRRADYNSSNSVYNGRWKRKFGGDDRYLDRGRDRGKRRGYSSSRSYDEDDEDGAPGFRKQQRGSGPIDEVGSSTSFIAEEPISKVERMGESELEDTGSKVTSNAQQNVDAPQAVEDGSEANKMQENSLVSNSEVVEQALNGTGNSNNASSDAVQEAETTHLPVPSDDKVSDGKPEHSSVLSEKVEDVKTSDEKADGNTSDEVSIVETNSHTGPKNLLDYCSFARVPTRRRSVPAHRTAASARREAAVAEQADPASSEEVSRMTHDGGNGSSLTSMQANSEDDQVGQGNGDLSNTCNQVADPVIFDEKETQGKTEEMKEQNNNSAEHCGVQDNKDHVKLSPTLGSHENNLRLHIENGIQIYNIDTPPQDEDLINSSDKGKIVDAELSPKIKAEPVAAMEEEMQGQSSSFKIRDLNLVGSPEVADMRTDHLGKCSTAGCSMELQDKQQIDFGTTVANNPSNTDTYAQIVFGNKTVQVIDIEDDPPNEDAASDTSKAKQFEVERVHAKVSMLAGRWGAPKWARRNGNGGLHPRELSCESNRCLLRGRRLLGRICLGVTAEWLLGRRKHIQDLGLLLQEQVGRTLARIATLGWKEARTLAPTAARREERRTNPRECCFLTR